MTSQELIHLSRSYTQILTQHQTRPPSLSVSDVDVATAIASVGVTQSSLCLRYLCRVVVAAYIQRGLLDFVIHLILFKATILIHNAHTRTTVARRILCLVRRPDKAPAYRCTINNVVAVLFVISSEALHEHPEPHR